MLELSIGLSPSALDAIAGLERRVVTADGGRLKLEWSALRRRSGREVEDVLWWQEGRLLGYAGIYSHGAPVFEVAGMVDPEARGRGIGGALLEAALRICQRRGEAGNGTVLLVVPRPSSAGRALAEGRGGVRDHSEHALRLLTAPGSHRADPRVTIRGETDLDRPAVRELTRLGFGWTPPVSAPSPAPGSTSLVIEHDGVLIGTVRMEREVDQVGIYGFVIHPDHRGRGIGRDVLHRLCHRAWAEGARIVALEVATDNDRALGLYTSVGFTLVTTEDYYAFAV